MNKQLTEINNMLRLMDNSIAKALETNDVNDLEDYNKYWHEIQLILYGNPWLKTPPIYTGFLHVDKNLEYLLPNL